MSEVGELLGRTQERIRPTAAWIAKCEAQDEWGGWVSPWDDEAVAWCATGSLEREAALGNFDNEVRLQALELLAVAATLNGMSREARDYMSPDAIGPYETVQAVNDVHGHAAVMAMFDKAAELEGGE